MKLYFGGAYNGKLDLILKKHNLGREDVFFCEGHNIEFEKKIIYGFHRAIYAMVLEKINIEKYLKENIENFKDKIIICDEITNGIVPIKREERIWREKCGWALSYISSKSTYVAKIYFGIEMGIKGNE